MRNKRAFAIALIVAFIHLNSFFAFGQLLPQTDWQQGAYLNSTSSLKYQPFEQRTRLLPSILEQGSFFSSSSAMSGNTVVSGAPAEGSQWQGAAYIFTRSGMTWTEQTRINGSGENEAFGIDVDIDGDIAVIGAPDATVGSNLFQGMVYVFSRNGSTWTQTARLTASDGRVDDKFGSRVLIKGNRIVVGAIHDTERWDGQGSVYIFEREGETWRQQAKIVAADGYYNDQFGTSLELEGDTLIVGVPGVNGGGFDYNIGAVYIFTRNGATWTQQAQLFGARTRTAYFGSDVHFGGNTLIVGSDGEREGSISPGSAWVFVRTGNSWQFQAKLLANDRDDFDQFGKCVRISGDTAIVTASHDEPNGNQFQGSAYIFIRSGTTWTQQQKITSSDGAQQHYFGSSLDFDGSTVIVGAIYANDYKGAIYTFAGNGVQNTRTNFDFDGDSKADQAVFRSSDRVWYLLRSSSGFTSTQFGISTDKVTPADFDGDGKTDIAVFRDGVWYWLNSSNNSFTVFQFGVAGDIPVPADFTGDGRAELAIYRSGIWYTSNLANSQFNAVQFGISTDKPVPADFDADGKTDFAVYRDGVWYMLRSTAGFTAVQFGIALDKATVGDYDGDGRADQAVYRSGVWYILGSTQGFYGVQFGISSDIPVAADYDGDGKTDIAIYRDGVWYMSRSQQGFGSVQFGMANDKPIPAAFVP